MNVIAVIPARYNSQRFPGKLMQLLGPKAIIRHTYDNTLATGLFSKVFVVTDSQLIYDDIVSNGGNAIMSINEHESGSDRIAEAVADMDVDIIINVQGDEPFVRKEPLEKLIKAFTAADGHNVQVASLMHIITEPHLIHNPNQVKVVVGLNNDALLFSRSPIPYHRDTTIPATYYGHIGVYAFRKQALMNFTKWPQTPMEKIEKLENLRYQENGVFIRMVLVDFKGVGVDTPEDLEVAKEIYKHSN